MNSYGIMEGSTIFLIIHQAELKKDQEYRGEPYIQITCGNSEFKTAPARGAKPVWDESFHLYIIIQE